MSTKRGPPIGMGWVIQGCGSCRGGWVMQGWGGVGHTGVGGGVMEG